MDCREWLTIKQYEFLMNYFMRRQQALALAELDEPYCYDGFSVYDQLVQQIVREAAVAYIECFGEPAPPIAFTNLFHLAELELAGRRVKLRPNNTLQ